MNYNGICLNQNPSPLLTDFPWLLYNHTEKMTIKFYLICSINWKQVNPLPKITYLKLSISTTNPSSAKKLSKIRYIYPYPDSQIR